MMITLITGENTFENERALKRIIGASAESAEKIDGSELELKRLPDLLMGGTLFANKRLVIIKNLSENKALWNEFENWIGRVSDDVNLVLVDQKPDKRTKTYKALQKAADVHESKLWTERDTAKAEQWVATEAKARTVSLDKKSAQLLVERIGVDQWWLHGALEKLALIDEVTPQKIEALIEPNPTESVFYLFDAALKGDTIRVSHTLTTLKLTEDPYRLFGLLSGQAIQLLALAVSDKPAAEVAKDMGVHPFALSKLAPYAKKYDRAQIRKLLAAFVSADASMKTTGAGPWLFVEEALIKVCLIK